MSSVPCVGYNVQLLLLAFRLSVCDAQPPRRNDAKM